MSGKMLTVISLFAGCGGSSLGYKNAGFRELLAIDFDKNAEETFKLNFPEVPFWNKDISKINGSEILNFCKIKKGELDILDASPPCQGFSTAGKRKINDSRNDLFSKTIKIIDEIEPKVFIIENVSGMIKGKMKGYFNILFKELKNLNYKLKVKLLNASNYDVPQNRQRLFFIGIREDLNKEPVFPEPNKKKISVKEALINCPKDKEIKYYTNKNEQYLIPKLKQGMQMSQIHPKGWGFNLMRLNENKPSNTIVKTFRSSQTGLLHPNEDRFLTISELKRLASFPDDFKFVGKFEDKWARIGNAVMPKQMEAIAKTIKLKILKN
jgi:DNA (cytosine-5)-methyltransferase 1